MGDSGVDRLLASLDVAFDAAVAREEDEAASDLAYSLLEDLSLAEALPRMGPLAAVLPGGVSLAVSVVGRDYVAAGSPPILIPVTGALLMTSGESDPEITSEDLLGALRRLARAGQMVRVSSDGVESVGRLRRAAVDHLLIEGATGRAVVVGIEAVTAVALVPEGSIDAP